MRELSNVIVKGISGLMAAVIVVCVGIAVAILVSFWLGGIVSISGAGSSPERLEIMSDLDVRGSEFKVVVSNNGGTTSVINSIYLDNKWEATVIDAYVYGKEWEKRIYDLGNGRLGAIVMPGERVVISCLLKNIKLRPGSEHEVKLVTARGSEFRRPVRAAWNPIKINVKALDLGIKNPNTGNKLILVKIDYYNAYTQPATHLDATVVSLGKGVNELGSYSEDLTPPVKPGQETNIMFTIQLSSSGVTGDLVVKVKIKYSGGAEDESAAFVESSKKIMAYVIAIDQIPGHWVDKSKVVMYVEKLLSNYHVISDLRELYEFIDDPSSYSKKYGLPVDDVIVINAHGEAVPIPPPSVDTSYKYVDSNGTPVKDADGHYTWFRKIREDIINHGWIWVAIDGYAFYYTWTYEPGIGNPPSDQDSDPDRVKISVGPKGGRDVFDVSFDLQAYKGSGSISVRTDVVHEVGNLLKDNSVDVSNVPTQRPARNWLSSFVKIWFYNFTADPNYPYGSALYNLGNDGYVLINGWAPANDVTWSNLGLDSYDYIAKSAVYFAVYSYIITKT